jgi:translocator protein
MNPEVASRPGSIQGAGLAGWLILCFSAAAVGAFASSSAGPFYGEIVRPAWAPPGWVFGPVWTVLYLTMGVAVWLVWREPAARGPKATAIAVFLAQLVANALWSWLFFAWRKGGLAFADIVILWLLIVCTVLAFWRIKPVAGLLLVPYLLWVSFASVLNWTLWRTNPDLLG